MPAEDRYRSVFQASFNLRQIKRNQLARILDVIVERGLEALEVAPVAARRPARIVQAFPAILMAIDAASYMR